MNCRIEVSPELIGSASAYFEMKQLDYALYATKSRDPETANAMAAASARCGRLRHELECAWQKRVTV